MTQAEVVLDAKVFLGEGPLWDADKESLWWINIFEGELFCFHPPSGTNTRYEMGQQIGTVVLKQSGGLAVALENGFHQSIKKWRGVCNRPKWKCFVRTP